MGSCDLSRDLLFDCENKPVKGSENSIVVLEQENISTMTFNATNKLIIEALTQVATTRAYSYIGNGNPINPSKSLISDENGVRWLESIPFTVEGNTPEIKNELNRLAGKPLLIITKNYYKGDVTGKSVYEVYGVKSPVYLESCEDAEGNMRWMCVFKNKDGYESSQPPCNLFLTSLTVTKAIVDSLLVATT
jgi:hypothetical protein